MDSLQIDTESAYRRQALMEEARVARSLKAAAGGRPSRPLGAILAIGGLALGLAARLRDWYLASGAPGYLPHLHID